MQKKETGEPMLGIWSLRAIFSSWLIFLLAAASPGLAQPATATPARLEQLATAAISPEALPKVLAGGATGLNSKIKALEGRGGLRLRRAPGDPIAH